MGVVVVAYPKEGFERILAGIIYRKTSLLMNWPGLGLFEIDL